MVQDCEVGNKSFYWIIATAGNLTPVDGVYGQDLQFILSLGPV